MRHQMATVVATTARTAALVGLALLLILVILPATVRGLAGG